jgi:hypothetical protein
VLPINDAAPIQLSFSFSASAGGIVGQTDPLRMTYLFDSATPLMEGPYDMHFPNAKRMYCTSNGASARCSIAAGSNNEDIRFGMALRALV